MKNIIMELFCIVFDNFKWKQVNNIEHLHFVSLLELLNITVWSPRKVTLWLCELLSISSGRFYTIILYKVCLVFIFLEFGIVYKIDKMLFMSFEKSIRLSCVTVQILWLPFPTQEHFCQHRRNVLSKWRPWE